MICPARLYDMTKRLMDRMNVEFEYQVRRSLGAWLLTASCPAGTGAAAALDRGFSATGRSAAGYHAGAIGSAASASAVALTPLARAAIPRAIPRYRPEETTMSQGISRRAFARTSALTLGSFAILRHARGEAPIELRCSLDTAPSHPRNVAFRDFLGKLEQASGGQVKTKLFESGSLFPDLQVLKALVQGQVEMACPGTWTITGFVADADFSQLPAFYGRPTELVHKAVDGAGGKFVNDEIPSKLHVEVLGPLVRPWLQRMVRDAQAA